MSSPDFPYQIPANPFDRNRMAVELAQNTYLTSDEMVNIIVDAPLEKSGQIDLSEGATLGNNMIAEIKRSLGYLEKPLVKCSHCGQWGAVYCACPSCGAPIDPKE